MKARANGYSMTEMTLVITLVGILASLIISRIGDTLGSSRLVVAKQKTEMLNNGVLAYNQSTGVTITQNAISGSAVDEVLVLHELQGRKSVNPTPGSPYVDPRYQPVKSSDVNDYRIQWNSNFVFTLLEPGTAGTGLKVPFDNTTDIGPPWVAPPDWNPGGR